MQLHQQIRRLPGFGDEMVNTRLIHRIDDVGRIRITGDNHANDFRPLLAHPHEKLHAGHFWHALITQNNLYPFPLQNGFGGLNGGSAVHVEFVLKDAAQCLHRALFIIQYQDRRQRLGHHRHTGTGINQLRHAGYLPLCGCHEQKPDVRLNGPADSG